MGGTEVGIKARIGKAQLAFTQLQKVSKASNVSTESKIRLLNLNIFRVEHGQPPIAWSMYYEQVATKHKYTGTKRIH